MSEQSAISKSMKHIIRAVAGAAALLGALGFAQAGVVVDPNQPVAGASQLELSQQWWQWVLGIPASGNPLLDTDGSFAQTDNNGAVFFVAGNVGGTSTRTFSVPTGRPLFFPLLNGIDIEILQFQPCFDPGVTDPLACALAVISPGMDNASNLHATLDGQNLLTFPSFRQTSTSFFDIELPVGNLFGVDAGLYPSSAVSDGYWVALDGLSPGRHTLMFGGTGGTPGSEFTVEVVDTLNVPEPGTASLVLLGALVALGYRHFGAGLRHLIAGRDHQMFQPLTLG